VPQPPDAETGIELGAIGIEVEALEVPEVDVPELAEPVAAEFDAVDAALEELELELPHAASAIMPSRTSPRPRQRVAITRPVRNIQILSSRSSGGLTLARRHRVNP
jgi:hypothetical protein